MAEIIRCDKCDNGIQPDWGYCAYCGDALLTADEKAEAYCQTPGTMPLPADPLDGLAEDMAKALEDVLRLSDMGLEESLRQPEENGNFAAYNRARAVLERFHAAKKEQA